jgi:hypothetical protein
MIPFPFPLPFFLFSMGFARGPPPVPIKKEWSYPNTVPNLIFVIIMMIEIQIHNNMLNYPTRKVL